MSDQHHAPSHNSDQPSRHDAPRPEKKPGFFQVLHSVVAAIFGIQSAENRERDFQKGHASDYIMVYVIIVIGLVIGMIITVNSVLEAAGK